MSDTIRKIISIILVILVVFSINCLFSYADEEESEGTSVSESEDGDSSGGESSTSDSSNTSSSRANYISENVDSDSPLALSHENSAASVTSYNKYNEANLHLNNILTIILIAVGVVLILLAIAILIRQG